MHDINEGESLAAKTRRHKKKYRISGAPC